jgi:hypothetical protein
MKYLLTLCLAVALAASILGAMKNIAAFTILEVASSTLETQTDFGKRPSFVLPSAVSLSS